MSYCKECGQQISEGGKFCTSCGTPTDSQGHSWDNRNIYSNSASVPNVQSSYPTQQQYMPYQQGVSSEKSLLDRLKSKIQTEAIVWTIIASLQVIAGLYYLGYGLFDYWAEESNIIVGIVLLIVAGINFFVCSKDYKLAKSVHNNPVGIVEKYRPMGSIIFTGIYNLLVGGVFGVVGTIFCFLTRKFVMENEHAFIAIENTFKAHTC